MSMWVRPTGTHSYSTIEKQGITNQHFFLLEGVFALWWDSPSSFRVYVFASKDYLEESTSSVQVPIH